NQIIQYQTLNVPNKSNYNMSRTDLIPQPLEAISEFKKRWYFYFKTWAKTHVLWFIEFIFT
ncbi:4937_t:CDS:1, partial [Scutellospora calospora]